MLEYVIFLFSYIYLCRTSLWSLVAMRLARPWPLVPTTLMASGFLELGLHDSRSTKPRYQMNSDLTGINFSRTNYPTRPFFHEQDLTMDTMI